MKSTKEVFSVQGPWHSPSTLPTTVHGQAFILFPYYPISLVVEEKKIKKQTTYFWHLWDTCFFCVLLINNKNINFLEDHSMNIPTKFCSNGHQWFQRRRLKTDNTLFDTFGPLVSCELPLNKKKQYTFKRTIQWTFLPSLVQISLAFEEKKIKR